MCIGGGSAPAAPPPAPPPPDAPTANSGIVVGASADQTMRARAAGGLSSTLLTGPAGLSAPSTTAPKALLGS